MAWRGEVHSQPPRPMVPTREDRGAQHTTWTDARMNAQVGGQHAVWGDAQASPVVPGPSGVSAAGVGGYEVEYLKGELEKGEERYAKIQAEHTKVQAFFEAYRDQQQARELQIEAYKQQVDTLSKHVEMLSKRVADYNAKEKELSELKTASAAQLAGKVGDGEKKDKFESLQTALTNMSSQVEAYIEEIDVISSEFDEIQRSNTNLLEQLTEQSKTQVKLRAQMLKQEKEVANVRQEMRQREEKQAGERDLHEKRRVERDHIQKEFNKMEVKYSELKSDMRKKEKVLMDLEAAEARLKKRVESLEAELESQRASHAESLKKRKLHETDSVHEGASPKKPAAQPTPSISEKELQRQKVQMKHYQKLLFCSICATGEKEVIIKRCLHMFCKECLSKSLQSRNRKCPACGDKFSQSEVQPIYWT